MGKINYSVIIPVFNAEKTLKKCVDSIIAENEPNIEIILVNDGSTDSSLSICMQYSKIYSNVITINKANGGVASARNAGMSAASGNYIVFVDSDDYILKGYFSSLNAIGDYDFVIFGMVEDNGKKTVEQRLSTEWDAHDGAYYILRSRNGGPWNKRFKRSLIEKYDLQYPTDLEVGEDTVFCLEYSLVSESTFIIHKPLYCYNTYTVGSLTRKYRPDYIESAIRFYNYIFAIVSDSEINKKYMQEILSIADYNYCRSAFVCAMTPLKYNLDISKEYSRILNIYSKGIDESIKPCGFAHRIMRFCLKAKLQLPLWIVSNARVLVKK